MSGPLYLMSPMEIAWGYLFGHVGTLPPPSERSTDPRGVLEGIVGVALRRPPCGVAFSGGRDSSLVLAVAAHVARRDGLPDPVPITRVFPDVAEAAEDQWQEAVVRHLRLHDWHRVVLHDELDVVGPIAANHLVEHGVVWPPTIGGDVPLIDAVPGGSVIDGEGGDEVLGVGAHRAGPVSRLLRSPRPLRWSRVRRAAGAVAPAGVRSRLARRRWEEQPGTWLRPLALDALLSAVERGERERPLTFAASVRLVPQRRTQVLGGMNRRALAERRGVEFTSPLLHPDFVHAIALRGGVLGPGDRTAVLREMVSDLLPDSVLSRVGKADFTRCFVGRHARQFAASWSGDGLDPDLVDAEALRREWLGDPPNGRTIALMQAACLATSEQRPATPTAMLPPDVVNGSTS